MNSIIIGTAGHIDHGKSALVRALTGTDPDRLLEEQQRGMTIDLGFAFLSDSIAFIDVPGHEKFVKNMVAGVSTVDYAMLVVAADDGVMPQTREHLDILSLLQLRQGLVVINKIDLVDEELLALVESDIREALLGTFLEKAPLFKVSSITGTGIKDLRAFLTSLTEKPKERMDRGFFWLPVDRSFTMKGFGTVVTGSVLSGRSQIGDTLEILPAAVAVKVRSLQSHGQMVTAIKMGDRAAVNLQNISREEVGRGDVLADPGQAKPTRLLDVRLMLLPHATKSLQQRSRVRIHLGTREIMGRVKLLAQAPLPAGQTTYAQLLLEAPAVALRHEPFVIRQYSPARTIGGGIVLDANPISHQRNDAAVLRLLAGLEKQNPAEMVINRLYGHPEEPASAVDIGKWCGLDADQVLPLLEELVKAKSLVRISVNDKSFYIAHGVFDRLQERILAAIKAFHKKEPLRPAMNKAELKTIDGKPLSSKILEAVLQELKGLGKIEEAAGGLRLVGFAIQLSAAEEQTASAIMEILTSKLFSPPDEKELAVMVKKNVPEVKRVLGALQGMGRLVRLEGDLYFTQDALDEMERRLFQFSAQSVEISVGQFRELLATSRKYAVPLLGYLDQKGATERVGDGRLINRQVLQRHSTQS